MNIRRPPTGGLRLDFPDQEQAGVDVWGAAFLHLIFYGENNIDMEASLPCGIAI